MFNWFSRAGAQQDNRNLWDGLTNQVFRIDKLEKELHGWQSAMYTLCNALGLDLIKDECGNVVIQYRKPETVYASDKEVKQAGKKVKKKYGNAIKNLKER